MNLGTLPACYSHGMLISFNFTIFCESFFCNVLEQKKLFMPFPISNYMKFLGFEKVMHTHMSHQAPTATTLNGW